jgi:hypothetical protein
MKRSHGHLLPPRSLGNPDDFPVFVPAFTEDGMDLNAPNAPIAPQGTLLVTGSRSITDAAFVFAALDALPGRPALLIHGGARGVDQIAGQWARARGIPTRVVRPDFQQWPIARYRWKAYTQRDYAMADQSDRVVALWDGHSSGTRLTKEYADRKGKLFRVVLHGAIGAT